MPMNCRLLLAERMADHRSVVVPSSRHTSSSFFRNWYVCSGLLRSNGLRGKSEGIRESVGLSAVGRRSTKLGVVGNTRNGLVPELSLLVSPRLERLCTPLRFTASWNPLPSSWSILERSDCFL